MCGIAGFTGHAGTAKPFITAMCKRLHHRGPDDGHVWLGDEVTLGHRRLAIVDARSRSRQPFQTADGQGVLSYNGEVYNFVELRNQLVDEGLSFDTQSDTEVVLAALHHWGAEIAVPKFVGMFAFAYFDQRTTTLWLARDRTGMKPLYYALHDEQISFASETNALFAGPFAQAEISDVALCSLVITERFESEKSLFQGVHSLEPGTIVSFSDGVLNTSCYFDVLTHLQPQRILLQKSNNIAELESCGERLLRRAVHEHMVGDNPVATMCSGGLDSGLVSAFARERNPDISGYVADIEGMNSVELARARRLAEHIKIDLRVVNVSVERYFSAVPQALAANNQPLFFLQDVAGMLVAEDIAADGFKVALTGDGADEIFGGYDWHQAAYQSWWRRQAQLRWVKNLRWSRWLGVLHPHLKPRRRDSFERDPLWPAGAYPLNFMAAKSSLLSGSERRLREHNLFQSLAPLPDPERAFLTSGFADLYVHMRERLACLDRLAMNHSLETRIPFLDNRVLDFGLHLPVEAKLRGRQSKYLIRQIAKRHLPLELIRKPKIGFDVPSSLWHGTHAMLLGGRLADKLMWSTNKQWAIIDRFSGHKNYLTRLVMIELWLRLQSGESSDALTVALLANRSKSSRG